MALSLGTEEGADFIKEATEASSAMTAFEPTHGLVALFDAPMVLLHMSIQVTVRPVHHPIPEDVLDGPRVGVMAVGGDAVGHHPGHRPGRTEEGLSRRDVAHGAELCFD